MDKQLLNPPPLHVGPGGALCEAISLTFRNNLVFSARDWPGVLAFEE